MWEFYETLCFWLLWQHKWVHWSFVYQYSDRFVCILSFCTRIEREIILSLGVKGWILDMTAWQHDKYFFPKIWRSVKLAIFTSDFFLWIVHLALILSIKSVSHAGNNYFFFVSLSQIYQELYGKWFHNTERFPLDHNTNCHFMWIVIYGKNCFWRLLNFFF